MRGDNFWKGVIVLCLTLLAGVFISDLFDSEKEKTKYIGINKELNCQPADSNLKYHLLSKSEAPPKTQAPSKKEPKTVIGVPVLPDLENFKRIGSNTKELLYRTDKDKFDSGTLLHKENCYEINGRK